MINKKVLFVGAGKMGYSLLSAWMDDVIARENIFVVEQSAAARSALGKLGIASDEYFPPSFAADLVVIAVKPGIVKDILPSVSLYTKKGAMVFTIVAGKNLALYETALGADTSIVRCMPNLCVEIQKGASGMIANKNVTEEQKDFITRLMTECGKNVWLEREEQIDAVTALSGSSPAYIAYFLDIMMNEAVRLGLEERDAITLVLQAARGTVALLKSTKETPEMLIKRVATPGGTTEAAMKVFKEGGKFKDIVERGLAACANRSKEIEKEG